jgi:hypothetical protein
MTRSTVRVVLALSLGVCACDSGRDAYESSSFSEPTSSDNPFPPVSTHIEPPPAPVSVNRHKELLVIDRAVLDGARSDGTRAEAPWSFRHLVETLAAPGDASTFVRTWLASWEASSTAAAQGHLPLGARSDVRSELVCPWLRLTPENGCDATCSQCTSEHLDLSRAPFRLLAIVNRLDLAEATTGCNEDASEARFVFVATLPGASSPLSFNAIFEYGANGTAAGDPKEWHALGSVPDQGYAAALERLTRSFTDRSQPGLKQLRTSENLGTAHGTSWELRQFVLASARLAPSALTNTVRDALDGTTELADHVDAHFSEIVSGDNAVTPALSTAVSTMPRADFRWSDPRGSSQPLDLFGLSTCNGCHAGHRGDTTILPFAHIGTNEHGQTLVSRFLDDPNNPLGDELAFRERSLARRLQGQCGSPEASYGGRRGGGGGLDKPQSGVKALARVH